MGYYTGTANDVDELLQAIAGRAGDEGWTVNLDAADGDGRRLHLEKNGCFANLRSTQDMQALGISSHGSWAGTDGIAIRASTGFDGGLAWDAQPGAHAGYGTIGRVLLNTDRRNPEYAAIQWPATYHVFAHAAPDVFAVVVEIAPGRFVWLLFGRVLKYGSWTGGGFAAASMSVNYARGANNATNPGFSIGGTSTVYAYAPFHRLRTGFIDGQSGAANSSSFLHAELDGHSWLYVASYDQDRKLVDANLFGAPINSRSPNTFNALGVMTPYWLVTGHADHRAAIGALEHVRQIPVDNFNPGDVFQVGAERWMVFPYLEKFGFTGRFGWAIRYDGP